MTPTIIISRSARITSTATAFTALTTTALRHQTRLSHLLLRKAPTGQICRPRRRYSHSLQQQTMIPAASSSTPTPTATTAAADRASTSPAPGSSPSAGLAEAAAAAHHNPTVEEAPAEAKAQTEASKHEVTEENVSKGSGTVGGGALPALPAPTGEEADTVIEVNGAPVILDKLGPMVIGRNGEVSRIANWGEMAEIEKKNTLRILGKRNQLRLANLRGESAASQGKAE